MNRQLQPQLFSTRLIMSLLITLWQDVHNIHTRVSSAGKPAAAVSAKQEKIRRNKVMVKAKRQPMDEHRGCFQNGNRYRNTFLHSLTFATSRTKQGKSPERFLGVYSRCLLVFRPRSFLIPLARRSIKIRATAECVR